MFFRSGSFCALVLAHQKKKCNGRAPVLEMMEARFLLSNYGFSTLASFPSPIDVSGPLVMDSNENLFGASSGGGTDNAGTIFEASPDGLVTLVSFDYANNGQDPGALTIDRQNNLFGATLLGSGNNGTLFEIAAGTDHVSRLAAFPGTGGSGVIGQLSVDAAGNIFGMTDRGGDNGKGMIFELPSGSSTIETLASFSDTGLLINKAMVVDGQGNIFVSCSSSGTNVNGAILELPAGSDTIITLASFDRAASMPDSLAIDSHGNLFGIATQGGANNQGEVFEIAAGTDTITNLGSIDYDPSTEGQWMPVDAITIDASDNVFGIASYTYLDGSGNGMLFELPAGATNISPLARYSDPAALDVLGLVADQHGNVFGLTGSGGDYGNGAVFEASPPPDVPVYLAVNQQPTDTTAGSVISSITVAIDDSNGQPVTTDASTVTVRLGDSSRPADLAGTTTATVINGIATFDNLSLTAAGTYTLSFSDDTLLSTKSASFEVLPSAATQLVFATKPAGGPAGSQMPAVNVDVEDQYGNIVTSDGSNVTLAASGFDGTLRVAAQDGVASFGDLSSTIAGDYTLTATDGSLNTATSEIFAIVPAAAAKIELDPVPAAIQAGAPLTFKAYVEDAYGNVVTDDQSNVSLICNPSGKTISAAAQNGVATFDHFPVTTAGVYSLSATDGDLTPATSASFTVNAAAASQFNLSTPTDTTAGQLLPPLSVELTDQYGNLIDNSTPVTLSIAKGPAGASLRGTLTESLQDGNAIFNDLSLTKVGSYVLSVTDGGSISGQFDAFVITPDAPASIAVSQTPLYGEANQVLAPIEVQVTDQFGNFTETSGVTLGIANGPAGAVLAGTTTVPTTGGVADFSDLSLSLPGTYTFFASADGLSSAVSDPLTITYSMPQLVFEQQPANTQAGSKMASIVVDAGDQTGTLLTNDKSIITLNLSAGAKLIGAATARVKNGRATFSRLSIKQSGSYTLTASAPAFASAQSGTFTVAPAAAKKAIFTSMPTNITRNSPFNVSIQLFDRYGNLSTTDSSTVTLVLGLHPRQAQIAGSLTEPVINGEADFNSLLLDTPGKYTLKAVDSGKIRKISSQRFIVA